MTKQRVKTLETELRSKIAGVILTVVVTGLMANAWAVYNDVKELKVKEPLNKEDLTELKTEMRDLRNDMTNFRTLLLQEKYGSQLHR